MKAFIRSMAFALSLLMLAACSPAEKPQDTAEDTTAAAETTTAEETLDPTLRANHFDAIPAEVKFGGATITCIFDCDAEAISGIPQLYIYNDLLGTDNSGDVLADAVWIRNQNTQDRLDIKLAWKPTGSYEYQVNRTIFQQLLMAQDNTFDFILSTGSSLAYVGLGQYMRDLKNMPHVDWESPWWWQQVNEDLSIDNKTMQFVAGDMIMTNLAMSGVTYFNKDMYQDIYGNPEDLYKIVLDGKWTIDKMHTLAQGAYKDVNGDGAKNEGDRFGLVWSNSHSEVNDLVVNLQADLYTRAKDGKLEIDMDTARNVQIVEKMTAILHDEVAVNRRSLSGRNLCTAFSQGASLFNLSILNFTASVLREMEYEYGIIPNVKLDENQERYLTNVPNSGSLLSVPAYLPDNKFEIVGAALEVLNGEAHRGYMDTFWEVMMKAKYSRDAQSGQCVDIIMNGLTKNVLVEYNEYSGQITRHCFCNAAFNQTSFATAYAANIEAAKTKWAESIAMLTGAAEINK